MRTLTREGSLFRCRQAEVDDRPEWVDSTVHIWDDAPGRIKGAPKWVLQMVYVVTERPPDILSTAWRYASIAVGQLTMQSEGTLTLVDGARMTLLCSVLVGIGAALVWYGLSKPLIKSRGGQ